MRRSQLPLLFIMPFTLSDIVPWGRSFEEYRAMFALTEADLGRSVLGCGDGPAAFNAGVSRRGGRVVSVDPIYQFSAGEIRTRIEATFETVLEQTRRNAATFVWDRIGSVEELGRVRQAAMDEFLADYEAGRLQGRYFAAGLPALPFVDCQFDLALCSHLLFLYSEQLSLSFHVLALRELCRVAAEVRVFPLLALDGRPSRHLEGVLAALGNSGLTAAIEPVDYEFQKGGNRMLRINNP
ncbi:MAG: hypothetical protein M0017_08850 [Desulfobacteraceae bacterium]|nr:hypothetical protein [Desulfobacteraceae bacterium]